MRQKGHFCATAWDIHRKICTMHMYTGMKSDITDLYSYGSVQMSSSAESCGTSPEECTEDWQGQCFKYRTAVHQLKRKVFSVFTTYISSSSCMLVLCLQQHTERITPPCGWVYTMDE